MKKFIIVGTGKFSDIVADLLERVLKHEVAAYVLDDAYLEGAKKYNGKEVAALSAVKKRFPPCAYDAAVGFIGKDAFHSRERVFHLLKTEGYETGNLIHPSAVISTESLGSGNIILENCVIGCHVRFGNGNIMWPLSSVNHHNTVGDFNNFGPGASTSGGTVIQNHCFLGSNSTYKNGVSVSDYTFVGAGAYITGDTEPFGVYVPEKSLKLEGRTADMFY